jgi:hypothetical protein
MSSSVITQQSIGVATEAQRGITSAQEMRNLLFDGNSAAFRNRIINGDMRIAQRGTDSGTVSLSNTFICDRFTNYSFSGTGRVQQVTVTDLPGFRYAQRYTVGSVSTRHLTTQRVEGFNVLDFPNKNVTMSFYVRGSKSFTFGFELYIPLSPTVQSYVKDISVTTSWQKIVITIPMYSSIGSYTNGAAFETVFNWYPDQTALTASSQAWVSGDKQGITGTTYSFNTANDWVEFTGASIENGGVETSFEYRPYTTEISLCQRYCYVFGGNDYYEKFSFVGTCGGSFAYFVFNSANGMRTNQPTFSVSALSNFVVTDLFNSYTLASIALDSKSIYSPSIYVTLSGTLGAGRAVFLQTNNTLSARLTVSAEL